MGTTRDVPIVLNNVAYEDSYDGDFNERRVLTYTLTFTSKFYLYGPVVDQKVIKQVQVDQYTDMPVNAPKREQRYTVTPNPITADADDNFGFNETSSFFEDSKNFAPRQPGMVCLLDENFVADRNFLPCVARWGQNWSALVLSSDR